MLNNNYIIDIKGITFWRKIIKNGQEYFVKDTMKDSFNLYFESINKNFYLELVTGRSFYVYKNEEQDNYIIYPSGISVSKELFVKTSIQNSLVKVAHIFNNKELEEIYTDISEDFIYNGYFCDIIAKRDNVGEIPAELVYDLIKQTVEKGRQENYVKCIKY